ncbi:filamentation protein-like protein [Bimuria novae-zelandiae CBS 107.79]|uniref:Filamentation protein-like protein n=1 Tax=Bimuria novae-zelandiae CBS 107.79 TaxID=1447943 RepID=A0A6A5VG61_9PLEO|nr:filamentation protein-like protein [Bimuria novae-zelandiae CBS 107.79]
MGNHVESEKALRYIAQLDDARCSGRWIDVPELCRKIEKHAPHRQCLTKTARSEVQIAKYSIQRPSTASSTASSGLSNIVPALLTAIEEEGDHVQDAFQATVCLAWLHYVLEEPGLALARLPNDLAAVATKMQEAAPTSWTRTCIVKGSFLKGSSHEKTGSIEEAVTTFSSILPWLSSKPIASETPQFRMWAEHLLVRLCHLSDQSSEVGNYTDLTDALQAYRFWAKYWETTAKGGGTEGVSAAKYRRLAWKAYYDTLSTMLRHDVPYEVESVSTDFATEKPAALSQSRLHQRAELKKVETIYESLLLKETHFPKANETNTEIEKWVDAAMDNWRIFCGPTWTDADLGAGGKEAVGRCMLDILYRAATKTFHSTQILRHLFTVHASLADFDLAFKAYDSYVDIITRGKDRAEKSGEQDVGIDNDSTILLTSAEAIRTLCRFGSRPESEKALEIGQTIEKWLEQIDHVNSSASEAGTVRSIETIVAPRSLAAAYYAIGISLAQWARFTYEADARAGIQAKAISYLHKSLAPKLEESNNLEVLYALALVLAETRDIPGSIKAVKKALSLATKQKSSMSADGVISPGYTTEFGRERKLIPFWHLLALLLTARSEFAPAEQACEAAFEQFGDPTILFGRDDTEAFRSEHLNQVSGKSGRSLGIVDQMERFEKSAILEIKMTQLALVETVEGSAAAVDGCDELLALYARLFGDPAAEKAQEKSTAITATMAPPKSAVGTIRGSIFRSKGTVKSPPKHHTARKSSVASSIKSATATQTTHAPTIEVTDENANDSAKEHHHHHLLPYRHREDHSGVQRSSSKLQKRSANSLRRRSELDGQQEPEVPELPGGVANSTPNRNSTVRSRSARRSSVASSNRRSESNERSLRPIAHNLPQNAEPPPVGHAYQPPKQDVRLPAPFPNPGYIPPEPHFSKIQERRHKVSLLTSVWLFICGLYTRADMHDDARDAVAEAYKLVEAFEAEIAHESSTSKAFAERGWGGGKSVEDLWGDVYATRGELLLAQDLKHDARVDFERAVLHSPDHPAAIVGLSNILLDIYCQVIPLERKPVLSIPIHSSPPAVDSITNPSDSPTAYLTAHTPSAENQLSPPELTRLAARDRAFGLLSILTKRGLGWDYSEAWAALARAYEESGQLDKTREVLWWCVELEDTHPVRSWKNVTLGGFAL